MTREGNARRLVLWDIDHTLIETRGVGNQLYRRAFAAVTGIEVVQDVDVTGRTEQAIFAEAARRHGLEPSDDLQRRYAVELGRQYELHAGLLREHGRALPGAADALAALDQVPGVVQTVLTGNLRAVALIKLRTFGLDTYIDFEIGAYSQDDGERAKLVAIARQRAGAKYGVPFTPGNTIIVGDTTNDVAAARDGGARIIAVASGRDTAEELRLAGAEVVLESLADVRRLLAEVEAIG